MANDRHLELSAKFIEMGRALMKEGKEKSDFSIAQTGSFLVLMGSLLFDEKDILLFGQFCSLFSARKILDGMENENHQYIQYLKNKAGKETYEDFIKRINKMRDDNGHTPIQ